MFVAILVPSICSAASAFQTAAGGGTSNGSQLRMKYLASTFTTTGDPPMPAFIDVVKTLEFNPTAQYNYNGAY